MSNQNDLLMLEINKAIEKDLPNQVGENLRKILEQGKQDADKVIQLTRVNQNQLETIGRHEATIKEYQKFDSRNAELEAREKAVKDKETQQKIDELTYQLAAEKDKTTFSQNVAMGLVRNTEYRKSIFDSEMSNVGGHYDQHNNWIPPSNITKSYTEDLKQE